MIKTLAGLILLAATRLLVAQDANSVQSWSSSDGKIIEAKFVRVEGDAVVIERAGKPFTVPFTKLAPESVELAKKLQKNTADGAATVAGSATIPATAPSIRFRWLQTDPKNADAIVESLKANNLSADAFSEQLAAQIRSKKTIEVVAFEKKIISGERFVLKPTDEKLPLVMEVEATVSKDGTILDLRCVPEWSPKIGKGSGLLRSNTATTLTSQRWYLFSRWGDSKTHTLLLARGGATPAKATSTTPAVAKKFAVTHLDVEWRETDAADLAKVTNAPDEDRANALARWRARAPLLACATITCKSGQKMSHEHLWGGKSDAEMEEELEKEMAKHPDKDPKEQPPRPGVIMEVATALIASEIPPPANQKTATEEDQKLLSQEVDIKLNATYVPLKAKTKTQKTEFVIKSRLRPGVPELVTARGGAPQGQPVVVMVITPWYDIIR